jgi:hypothetical protein
MRPPKIVHVSENDVKSSIAPVTSDDLRDWVPWNHGEIDARSVCTNSKQSLDRYIEKGYKRWLVKYNKQGSAKSFSVWKDNYLALLDQSEDGMGGCPSFELNEFGDLTRNEHRREVLLLEAYTDWCKEYHKVQDPEKYSIFKLNLFQQVINSPSVDDEIVLNENADQVANLDFYLETLRNEPRLKETSKRLPREQPRERTFHRHKVIGSDVSIQEDHKRRIQKNARDAAYFERYMQPPPNYVQPTQKYWKDSDSSRLHP